MEVDKIITDEKILRQISEKATEDQIKELDLINRLKKSNATAWTPGCGLAAIQIGIPLRVAWYTYEKNEEVLFNPEIITKIGHVSIKEGCLSIPDKWTEVSRAYNIEYINNGKKKKAKGMRARIIQHEIDHMNGILNIDKGI